MYFDIFHTVLGQRREIKPDLLEFLLQKAKGKRREEERMFISKVHINIISSTGKFCLHYCTKNKLTVPYTSAEYLFFSERKIKANIKNIHPKMQHKDSFCWDVKYIYFERHKEWFLIIPKKSWFIFSEMETFLPRNDHNNKPRFLSPSLLPSPLSFSWKYSDHLAVPMSDHSILI